MTRRTKDAGPGWLPRDICDFSSVRCPSKTFKEAIIIWNITVRILSLLLLLICSGNAAELLRDIHTDTEYIFKSDAKDVPVRISREDALLRADEWAAGFYGDALLQFVKCQFKIQPIRHWLVAFLKAETGQEYFAIVLPDGRIVAPSVERGLRSLP
jgi:hypothetical protein